VKANRERSVNKRLYFFIFSSIWRHTARGQEPTSLGCGIVEIDAWGFGESREEKNLSRVKITLLESAGKDKDETERTKTSLRSPAPGRLISGYR
jgi:hypothetical protein